MLTDEQRTYMIGKMLEARKRSVGAPKGNTNAEKQTGQNDRIVSTRETKDGTAGQIGNEVGMSEKNVRRAEKFAKGIDAIRNVSPEAAKSAAPQNGAQQRISPMHVGNKQVDKMSI